MSQEDLGMARNEDDLKTTFAEELISSSERNLNDTSEFGQLFRSVGFDVGNTLFVMSGIDCI